MPKEDYIFDDDPLWYKDAIIYELHVKTFFDSNGDGLGDFRGLIAKLDYLVDLGINTIWILPFYPSPLRDDGYDIADYFNVHPQYGTLRDFKDFMKEAHRRGIRVITELVLNHTSDEHAWFQKARKAKKGSTARNYYVWNDTPEKYQDARIIFKDFESSNWSWDPVAKQYFWHRFYSHQPDLNFESPQLQKAMEKVLDFWLEMGVDGMRLDAIPYLFEKEGTNCENLPATYEYLKKLRKYLNSKYSNRMFLAEANQWPEDAVAYFGKGDICHMAFHFPLMPRMFMALQMADRFPIVDILEQTPAIPEESQWAMFLRNHDELTLEMVTDEERDYMYNVYAQDTFARINLGIRRRLAPLLGNHQGKMQVMNILLFTLPGTPVIYYGDEIGMGDNYYLGDRNGVRTPMQWSSDRNAGFSRANPHKLYLPVIIDPAYHYEAVNVENQQTSSASLLWWMKQTIAVRKRYRAFSRGTLVFLMPENPKIVSFLRIHESQVMFVAVNLSKFSQTAEFDLTGYSGYVPEEVFSNNAFPPIKEEPYTLTFAPFGYYIFELKREEVSGIDAAVLPELRVKNSWENVFAGAALEKFERRILPAYLKQRRWFGGKARTIRQVRILEKIPVRETIIFSYFLIIEVKYSEGMPEKYVLPLSFASHGVIGSESGEFVADGTAVRVDNDWLRSQSEHILQESSEALISKIYVDGEEGFLFDSLYNPGCRDRILSMISRKKRLKGEEGEIFTIKGKLFPTLLGENPVPIESRVMKADHSNTALIYGDRFFFKLYRRTAEGLNPDMEIIRFLTEKTKFTNIPPFAGAIEYRGSGRSPYVIGILQGFVQNQGDTWTYSQDAVKRCFERLLAKSLLIKPQELNIDIFDFDKTDVSPELQEIVGGIYLEMVRLLGERTAELHLALSSSEDDPDFTPEPFSLLYQRSLYQSLRSLTKKVLQPFEKKIRKLPEGIREEAKTIAAAEKDIIKYYEKILGRKFAATKMRIHGDYHLGQVLYTGKDFIVIDFEGEPARALSERKLKRSPLVDIAGMLRSFHYAVHAEYFSHIALRPEDAGELALWLDPWYKCICKVFLNAYVSKASSGNFLPKDMSDFKILLEVFMLEKAVYELGYELNNRPEWLVIPFQGIKSILGLSGAGEKKE